MHLLHPGLYLNIAVEVQLMQLLDALVTTH
jgi:hypothetical protein